MNKILFVYPHNFLEPNMGTNIRVYSLAKELRAKGFKIDLFAFRNFISKYDRFEDQNKEKLVNQLYLYDYRNTSSFKRRKGLGKYLNKLFSRGELDNWVTPGMQRQFNEIVSSVEYDYIVMFYAYTAELLSPANYKGTASKVYFMEDLLSVSYFISRRTKSIGRSLDSEIQRVSYFDKIVCISSDEKTLFEKLLPDKSFYFLPHLIGRKESGKKAVAQVTKVLFIGYDNEYNIEAMRWFFQNVYSRLLTGIEIMVVGKVVKHINVDYPNLKKVEYVESLDELYKTVDIVICPLRNGTGMKIKVIEAMSYGIPVVCTSRGVDGLPDKNENGCLVEDTPEAFAEAINRLATDKLFYKKCQDRIDAYFSETLDWNVHNVMLARLFEHKSSVNAVRFNELPYSVFATKEWCRV